jgi:hypothetical protein
LIRRKVIQTGGGDIMNIKEMDLSELIPYKQNQKQHTEKQIKNVAESIKQYGFVQPIVIDRNKTVIIGHCRLLAAHKLNMLTVPCVLADDLTDEQVRALRIVDNKTNESMWDIDVLEDELNQINLSDFDFSFDIDANVDDTYKTMQKEFVDKMKNGDGFVEDEEYTEFVEKFKPKKTTDDCYTPDNIYNVVANYVSDEYGKDKNTFVRPFYPGGDYENYPYKENDVVVDNPPFSIISKICSFYKKRKIPFFLFAPTLTVMGIRDAQKIICGIALEYANGAQVNTSFVTNIDSVEFKSCPLLYKQLKAEDDINRKNKHTQLPKYEYPIEVVTGTMIAKYSKLGINFSVKSESCYFIQGLESQKKNGASIFGSGYLISERAATERAATERAAAETAAERAATEKWQLSEAEKEIIKNLL